MADKKANGSLSTERVRLTDREHTEAELFYSSGVELSDVEKQFQVNAVTAPTFMDLSSQLSSPRRGTRELLKIYSDSPWLRAIVNKIGKSVAETQWLLFSAVDGRGNFVANVQLARMSGEARQKALHGVVDTGDATRIVNHPLLNLLDRGTGNPRLNGFACIQLTAMHIDLVGEAFWLIEKNELGAPETFWPLPPSWVRRLPTESHPFYELSTDGGLVGDIPASMVVPFIDPDPKDPYQRGTGISKSLDDEIQIDEYAAKHQKSFFLNRARPDIIISGQFINSEDAKRLERKWLSDHQGFWKSFKPLFFSNKIDVKELSQSFESMQMVQVRKQERDTFQQVFGVPPEKLGIIGESKRSTIAAADMFWTKDIIRPRVETIRRPMQGVLVPMFDERLILSYETPVIQEDEFKLQVMRFAPWAYTLNQWQELSGAPGFGPAGDVLMVPLNMQLIPVKGENGIAITPDEVAASHLAAIAARGNVPDDADQIASVVTREISNVIKETMEEVLPGRNSNEDQEE